MDKKKCKKDEKKNGISTTKEGDSSEVLLALAKDRLEQDATRHRGILNRSGIFVSAVIAIITLVLQRMPFEKISELFRKYGLPEYRFNYDVAEIALGAILFSLGLIIKALIDFYRVIKVDGYCYPNVNIISDKNEHNSPKNETVFDLCEHYKEIIEANNKITAKIAKRFNQALAESLIASMFLIIAMVVLNLAVA